MINVNLDFFVVAETKTDQWQSPLKLTEIFKSHCTLEERQQTVPVGLEPRVSAV